MTVYVLKVALKHRKRIWRKIEIAGAHTLHDLHETIFAAFDRYDEHLYSFYLPLPGSTARDRLRKPREYTHPAAMENDAFPILSTTRDASRTPIDSLRLTKGQKFEYVFDFGDFWQHEITVERTDGEPDDGEYPRVVKVNGESPPQYPDNEGDEPDDE